MSLTTSFAYCERLARLKAGNFYHGFRLLPRPQRLATCALYAFLRVTDDITDDGGTVEQKRLPLLRWRTELGLALEGRFSHPVHEALHATVKTYRIPHEYLELALDGVGMDLEIQRYETFAELYRYCYRVASVVGLACIHIWGFRDEAAKRHAEAAGIAFQLTNILRDLSEDSARGRIYLPRADLRAFDYREDQLDARLRDEHFTSLMKFEVNRAREYYEEGERLLAYLPPPGRAVFQVMMRTYRGLLDAIVRHDFDVFSQRIQVGRCRKLWLTLQALPVRWGWTADRRGKDVKHGRTSEQVVSSRAKCT